MCGFLNCWVLAAATKVKWELGCENMKYSGVLSTLGERVRFYASQIAYPELADASGLDPHASVPIYATLETPSFHAVL